MPSVQSQPAKIDTTRERENCISRTAPMWRLMLCPGLKDGKLYENYQENDLRSYLAGPIMTHTAVGKVFWSDYSVPSALVSTSLLGLERNSSIEFELLRYLIVQDCGYGIIRWIIRWVVSWRKRTTRDGPRTNLCSTHSSQYACMFRLLLGLCRTTLFQCPRKELMAISSCFHRLSNK